MKRVMRVMRVTRVMYATKIWRWKNFPVVGNVSTNHFQKETLPL